MRIALEIVAILERAGLALVDVDRHEARCRLAANDAPFAPRRKSGAAQSPQRRALHLGDDVVGVARAVDAFDERAVAAVAAIRGEIDVRRGRRLDARRADRIEDARQCRVVDRVAADDRRGRLLAAPDARGPEHANVGVAVREQRVAQRVRTGHPAGQRLADPDGDRRRRCFVGVDDVEVVIERGDLVDLGHCELHFLGERHQVDAGR